MFLLGLFALLVATACSNDPVEKDDGENIQDEMIKDENDDDSKETPKVPDSDKEDDRDDDEINKSNVGEYPEYKIFRDEVPEADQLEGFVEEDNSNKRIILFSDESDIEKYKTIYIKHENKLKIISLNDDEKPIFHDVIDDEA